MEIFNSNKQKEKVYTAFVIVGVIASIMLFAGLSSAVLVRKMDKFWVNIHLPDAFIVSTILIFISSIFFYLALRSVRVSKTKNAVACLLITLFLSIGFTFFQFRGWSDYYNQGNAVKSFITFIYGQYGQSYKVCIDNMPIEYDGENYLFQEEPLSKEELKNVKLFLRQICGYSTSFNGSNFQLKNYNSPYSILSVIDNEILINSSNGLSLKGDRKSVV